MNEASETNPLDGIVEKTGFWGWNKKIFPLHCVQSLFLKH
jgi:hypothetical protein